MKKILTLFCLINFTILYAQNEPASVKGEWKIVSVDSGDLYLNIKTDSVAMSEKFKEVFSDSLKYDDFIKVAKLTYNNNIMTFAENGIFTQTYDPKIVWTGTYQLNPSESKISVSTKDVNWEMDYKIIDELLYLKMGVYDKNTEFVLEKIGK